MLNVRPWNPIVRWMVVSASYLKETKLMRTLCLRPSTAQNSRKDVSSIPNSWTKFTSLTPVPTRAGLEMFSSGDGFQNITPSSTA